MSRPPANENKRKDHRNKNHRKSIDPRTKKIKNDISSIIYNYLWQQRYF